jgi:hypothetical protein
MECWSKQAVGVIRGPKWPKEAQGLPHARQLKALVLELERFDWISSTKDEGILVFDEPLKILALNQLNGVG